VPPIAALGAIDAAMSRYRNSMARVSSIKLFFEGANGFFHAFCWLQVGFYGWGKTLK